MSGPCATQFFQQLFDGHVSITQARGGRLDARRQQVVVDSTDAQHKIPNANGHARSEDRSDGGGLGGHKELAGVQIYAFDGRCILNHIGLPSRKVVFLPALLGRDFHAPTPFFAPALCSNSEQYSAWARWVSSKRNSSRSRF